ncbi:HAD family hydrolase [Streptomyces tropicalis]|uniref:HAD family hydrolase n=1 Tax=Streptomyces tropicalis TaxID=3034234 RepID=A0ABT6A2E3_9ACTN|nr:HAD family hydrolase [Streptomyces tropicalis]MDF3298811.1 HAD family hydrolase [Streptomyces tropicalis]
MTRTRETPAAVLFDVDGTLMDTVPLHTVAWWEAFRQQGRTVAMSRIHRAIGMSSGHLLDALLGEDRPRDADGVVKAAHDALYAQYWSRLAPLDRAGDLLRACAGRGIRVVLASSASGPDADAMRKALDADDAIHAMTTADDVKAGKPAPDLVQRALEKSGSSAERAVFVGDAVWDAAAAGKAGVRCLGLLSGGGFSSEELRAAGAEAVYDSPADLLHRIDESAIGELAEAQGGI